MNCCFGVVFKALLCCSLLLTSTLAIDRYYYIGIVEVEWDYATASAKPLPRLTSGGHSSAHHHHQPHQHEHEQAHENHHHHEGHSHGGTDKCNCTSFVKAVFRLFTDATFTEQIEHPAELGLMGPLIIAEPGDRLHVHCKNFARFDFNMHPHLVRYDADEGPGAAAYGGKFSYEWHVGENDGPLGEEEPCILGAYHSGLSSLISEIEAGLIGPIVVCKRNLAPEQWHQFHLKSGDLLAFAIPKVFSEKDSIYNDINEASSRETFVFPTINGLTRRGSDFKAISLFDRLSCETKTVYMPTFTLGGSTDFQLMTTSCGLMMQNGRSLVDTLSLYSAGFRVVSFPTQELVDNFVLAGDDKCFLQSSCSRMRHLGMSVNLFPNRLANCPNRKILQHSEAPPLKYELSVKSVDWKYGLEEEAAPPFQKLLFAESSDREKTNVGLVGPTIFTTVSGVFQVLLKVPRNAVDCLSAGQGHSELTLGVKMPNVVGQLSAEVVTSSQKEIETLYTFFIKPPRIATPFDSPCRPFVYSAVLMDGNSSVSDVETSPFDTGLFGPLVVCESEKFLKVAEHSDTFFVAPIVIDESKSWLASANNHSSSKTVFHTINGMADGSADFGVVDAGRKVRWHLLSVPPLPGRQVIFHHSITFNDQGQRNPVYFEQMQDQTLVPGSAVVLHGCGKSVVMDTCSGRGGRSRTNGLEKWSIYCEVTGHHGKGMSATFSTRQEGQIRERRVEEDDKTPHYVIVAKEIEWDYKGNVSVPMAHHHHGDGGNSILSSRRHVFRKIVYRLADNSQQDAYSSHLGILGPLVKITPRRPAKVTLINKSTKPINIVPGGGIISQLIKGTLTDGGSIAPGGEATFQWHIPDRWPFPVPSSSDWYLEKFPDCSATLYSSTTDVAADLYAGLVGPILICPNILAEKQPVHRLFSLYIRFDEGRSRLLEENQVSKADLESTSRPLVFDTVNGRLMGAVEAPGFAVYANESVDWFMFAAGDYNDIHTVHYHGSAFRYIDADTHNTPRVVDTVTVFPGQSRLAVAGRMHAIPPGVWPIHCHVLEHARRGMMAQYTVYAVPRSAEISAIEIRVVKHHPYIERVFPYGPVFYQWLPYFFILFVILVGLRFKGSRLASFHFYAKLPLRIIRVKL